MDNMIMNNNKAKERWSITVKAAIITAMASLISFLLMLFRVSHMHVIFFLVAGVSFLLVTFLVLRTLSAYEKYARTAKILLRCYVICLAIGLTCFIVLQGLIISGTRTDDADVDVVIILGAGLRNSVPGLMLASRLDEAVIYLETRDDIPVIVTGGLGRGESITEAEAMSRYLIARGINESRIWKEEKSTSTRENLIFALDMINEKGLDAQIITVAIISNEFHLYRAKLTAEKIGMNAIGVAAETPGIHRRMLYYFREAFSLLNELRKT